MSIWSWIKKQPEQSNFMTYQEGKDLIVCFYHKFADNEIDIAIKKVIENKIEELATKSIHNKTMKRFINKKANEIFERFLANK